jgi:hypothetical protein
MHENAAFIYSAHKLLVFPFTASKRKEENIQNYKFTSLVYGHGTCSLVHVDGVTLLSLTCGHQRAYYSSSRWHIRMEGHGANLLTRESRGTRWETCPSAALSTTKPTGTDRAWTRAATVRLLSHIKEEQRLSYLWTDCWREYTDLTAMKW